MEAMLRVFEHRFLFEHDVHADGNIMTKHAFHRLLLIGMVSYFFSPSFPVREIQSNHVIS
jgi:hypothetical protein